jgi:tetratricopeptide (TPR) repeat protein
MTAARRTPGDEVGEDDLAAAGLKRRGGMGKWMVGVVLLAVAAGAGFAALEYLPTVGGVPGLVQLVTGGVHTAPQASTSPDPVDEPAAEPTPSKEAIAEASADETAPAGDPQQPPAPDELQAEAASAAGSGEEAPGEQEAATVEAKPEPEPVRDYHYYLKQGDRQRMRDRTLAAIESYTRAEELGPDRAEPVAGRGLALLDRGQLPQAESAFKQALGLNPRYAVAIMGLAETYRTMGKNRDAVEYYQRYLEVLPNGPEAQVARSAIQRLKE